MNNAHTTIPTQLAVKALSSANLLSNGDEQCIYVQSNVTKLCISVLQASIFADGVVPSVDDCQSELYRSRSQRSDFNATISGSATTCSGLNMPMLSEGVGSVGGGVKFLPTGSSCLFMRPNSKRNLVASVSVDVHSSNNANISLDSSQRSSSQMSCTMDGLNASSSALSMISASSSSVASPSSPNSPAGLMAPPPPGSSPAAEAWRPRTPPSLPNFAVAPSSPPESAGSQFSPIGAGINVKGANLNYQHSPLQARVMVQQPTDVEFQAWDQLSDVLMRVCVQVETLLLKKPNYYGVFDGRLVSREIKVLIQRALVCLNLILHRKGLCVSKAPTSAGQRNAPFFDEDIYSSNTNTGAHQMQPRTSIVEVKRVHEITGRIFWEEHCDNRTSVPWAQFSAAFQRVYGKQPARAMDQFMRSLINTNRTSKFDASGSSARCKSPIRKYAKLNNNNCPPTPGGTPNKAGNNLHFFAESASNSSHSGSGNKNAPLSPHLGSSPMYHFFSETSSVNGKNAPLSPKQQRTSPSAKVESNDKFSPAKAVVRVESFASFCMDHGGLFEGFIHITDPATQVLCLGSIEEDPQLRNANGETVVDESEITPLPARSIGDLHGIKVLQVCCGGEHAVVLGEGGYVYTWGKGGFGRLGHGDHESVTSPRRVMGHLKNRECTKVACGFAYTTAITSDGRLYAWGAGENGRLGVGDERDRFQPTKVLLKSNVKAKDVQAGSVHTCLLTQKGRIYSFGKHEYTGHGDSVDVLIPKKLEGFIGTKQTSRISQISVGPGGYHTIALTVTGDVYTWGHNRVGQLGYCNSKYLPKNVKGAYFIPTPKRVFLLCDLDVTQVVAGWGHSAVVTASGELHTCGRNFQGQLGLGNPDDLLKNERGHPYQPEFKRVEALANIPIAHISCGGEHSVALSEKGDVYTFGKGHLGQLGHDDGGRSHNLPKLVRKFKEDGRKTLQVACGNNCTLVLRGHYKVPSLFSLCRAKIRKTMDPKQLPATVVSIFEDLPDQDQLS
mmetsp:Transcript_13981/g.21458  ORF Transcript_13981/g.21458 Transcript_13981/m.21458 type:complete len:1008 (-) Transcript_13981:345-3368(-)|eukprot:CAMPEP_0196811754 /NCGR_PEP_ID=MMETSP1362-20130617/20039_1 /TAXON_ID=163516 /ORGANISM="Leptocylindrus danicus, Strain CCMP1856" /LENGTH=1007 /DNA_ID=CAMNT_0042187135 /DNA_START=65 /DNA_END=3088 /DNA_ORIENTATION=-